MHLVLVLISSSKDGKCYNNYWSGFVCICCIRPIPEIAGMKTNADISEEPTTDIVTKVVFIQKSGHLWTNWATSRLLQNSGV